jgi:uncharacterized protein YcgI (DUF1989 family)
VSSLLAETIDGRVVADFVIPACRGKAFWVRAGETVRFIDVEGQQCADLIALDAQDLEVRMSPTASISVNGHLYMKAGDTLVDDALGVMLTLTADTVEHHDILCGSCSPGLNRSRHDGLGAGKRTCHVNFVESLREYGVASEDVPYSFNLFMNYPISIEGRMEYATCKSRPGDYVDLRAERDLLMSISNCPQELTPLNGFNPTSSRVIVFVADAETSNA